MNTGKIIITREVQIKTMRLTTMWYPGTTITAKRVLVGKFKEIQIKAID